MSRALLLMTSKTAKLPLETEPVASDNNMIFMLKHGDQTFVAPYSTDNRIINHGDLPFLRFEARTTTRLTK